MKTKLCNFLCVTLLLLAGMFPASCKHGDNTDTVDEATAKEEIDRQHGTHDGSLPLALIDLIGLPVNADVTLHYILDSGNNVLLLARVGGGGHGGGIPCPPNCLDSGKNAIENIHVIADKKMIPVWRNISEDEMKRGAERFKKAYPNAVHSFVFGKDARKWLQDNDAATAIVIPARDKDNNHIILLSGYKADRSRIANTGYYVIKTVCPPRC